MLEDIDKLSEKAFEIIRRELNHISLQSSSAKLKPASARDLVLYMKLLADLEDQKKKAAKELEGKSPEELKALAVRLFLAMPLEERKLIAAQLTQ